MTDTREMTIVVEGITDVVFMRALCGQLGLKKTRFFSGDGQISLATLARNILVHEGGPVLVIMDADTTDADQAEESRSLTKFVIQQLAHPSDFEVHAFVPALEVIYFEAPDFLESALGKTISANVLQEGMSNPKATLNRLASQNGKKSQVDQLAAAIDSTTMPLLLQSSQARLLIERIQSLMHAPTTA